MDIRRDGLKMRFLLLLCVTGLASCAHHKDSKGNRENAKQVNEVSFDVDKHILDNGLTILLVKRDHLPIFSYYTFYKVGSKFEGPGITGATHFLEHMMFKGAKKYGEGMFDKLIEGNGGSNNAYTTMDLTVYYENLPAEHIEQVIDIEADRMQNLALAPASFEKERNVILEERKMRYENSDNGKLYKALMKELYRGTPYGHSVIGTIPDLKSVTRDQIHDYFKTFYAPNNAVIVIVGDINRSNVLRALKQSFGAIPKEDSLAKVKKERLEKKGFKLKKLVGRRIGLRGSSPTPQFLQAWRGNKVGEKEGYALDILASILGGGESSYLYQKLVLDKKPMLTNVYSFHYSLQETGALIVGGQLLPKTSIASVNRKINWLARKACKEALTQRNVEKVKNNYLVSFFASLETNAEVAELLGKGEVYFSDYNFYKKEFELYDSVTIDELQNLCRSKFKGSKNLFMSVWQKHAAK